MHSMFHLCTLVLGLEVAGFLTGKAESVTVVGRSPVPLKSVLGDKVGIAIKKVRRIHSLLAEAALLM